MAETEHARAEEQALSAQFLRQRAYILGGVLVLALLLAGLAMVFARQSNQNETVAQENAALASTREMEALAEAQQRATAQAQAEVERERADDQREVALAAEAQAKAEADIRATAEAVAVREREVAEDQAALATARELASAAVASLDIDPELSILLAMQALSTTHTIAAEETLHQAVQASRVRQTFHTLKNVGSSWLASHPDGSRLFSSGLNGGVMWDVVSGDMIFSLTAEDFEDYLPGNQTEFWINRADFNPDGSLIALPFEVWIGDDPQPGHIAILDAFTGEEILVFQAHEGGIQDVTFSPDGSQLAAAALAQGPVKIWDVPATLASGAGQELISLCCHEDWVLSVNYSPDGARAVTASEDKSLRVWDIVTGSELFSIVGIDQNDAVFSPDGQFIIVGGDRDISIFEAASGERYSTAPGPGQNFIDLLFNREGNRLAASNYDGRVRIWDYAEGELTNPMVLSGHKDLVAGVSFTPDGRYLSSGSSDGTVRVWDVSLDGSSEFGTYAHDSRAMGVAFSPDGSWLVSTSLDGTTKIWDMTARKERFTLRRHEDWVVGVTVHPDEPHPSNEQQRRHRSHLGRPNRRGTVGHPGPRGQSRILQWRQRHRLFGRWGTPGHRWRRPDGPGVGC